MTASARLAFWLLERFSPRDGALAGDLFEQVAMGRSSHWLWRQVGVALLLRARSGSRAHVPPALRAAMLGWASLQVWFAVLGRPLSRTMNGPVFDWLNAALPSHPIVMLWATDLHNLPALALGGLVSGWVVGRFNRAQPGAVLTVACTVTAWLLFTAVDSILNPTVPGYENHASVTVFIVLRGFVPSAGFLAGAASAMRSRAVWLAAS
ncbi:MAG: hypothetical protein AB7P67_08835 [Vicinamibacterales bacterium]